MKSDVSTTATITPTNGAAVAFLQANGFPGAALNTAINVTETVSIKRSNEFLAAARAGFVVNGWMPYVKAGLSNAKFESGTASARLNGFLVGAGVETVLSDHVVVGGEWTTVNYKAKNGVDVGRTQEFKVRLGYKF